MEETVEHHPLIAEHKSLLKSPVTAAMYATAAIASVFTPLGVVGLVGTTAFAKRSQPVAAALLAAATLATAALPSAFNFTSYHLSQLAAQGRIEGRVGNCHWGTYTEPATYYRTSLKKWGFSKQARNLTGTLIDCQGNPPRETYLTIRFDDGTNVWALPYHVQSSYYQTAPEGYENAANRYWNRQPLPQAQP